MSCKDCKFVFKKDKNFLCILNPISVSVDPEHYCHHFFPMEFTTVGELFRLKEILGEQSVDLYEQNNAHIKEIQRLKLKIKELEQKSLKPAE